jgi:hypothetical protein
MNADKGDGGACMYYYNIFEFEMKRPAGVV